MALLPIIRAGDPVLKQVAQPVERVTKELRQLLDDMAETMYASDGVGLAAPQVNRSIRVLVLDDGVNGLMEFINPVILKRDGEQIGVEGCLSVPGLYGDVCRSNVLTVEYINRHNKKMKLRAEGFLARIIQHEMDHLDGVLFIERAQSLRAAEATQPEV